MSSHRKTSLPRRRRRMPDQRQPAELTDQLTASLRSGSGKPGINLDESPLAWLARRKDKDGRPMLSDAEVAGRRKAARRFLVCANDAARDRELVAIVGRRRADARLA